MSKALELLGADADRIQPLFITVDPARDTLPRLREYVGYFHPRLLGLTGPETMIARVAGNFRVRYEKVASTDSRPDRYAVDHTASLFLLGPDGRFITKFAHGFPADRMAERLSELMQQ
jgi:protein SCO1/2